MSNESSNLDATPGVHLLKDQITQIESTLKHLHSVMGARIDALDRTLVKGENVKPVKTRSHLLKAAASPLSAGGIFSDFVRSIGSAGQGSSQSSGSSDLSFGSNSYGMSQGQIWAGIASAVSKASSRYM